MLYTASMHGESAISLLSTLAAEFLPTGVARISRFSAGHIHDSYIVTPTNGDSESAILLQRINTGIFVDPAALMDNIRRVTGHIAEKIAPFHPHDAGRRCLTLVPTQKGELLARDPDGGAWRAYRFIPRSRCEITAKDPVSAEICGRAFGQFLTLLADLPDPPLQEILPGFHDTPRRFEQFESAVAKDAAGRAASVREEIGFLRAHREVASRLILLLEKGVLPRRIAHNDAKISNVLFEESSDEVLCVVDLDLVMPGTALFDFGDMVRSMTSCVAEDEPDCGKVDLRIDLYEGLARGFVRSTSEFLLPAERAHLVDAGVAITLEQAARFLGDHIDGDRYYRIHRAHQNLDRARTQIALAEQLLRATPELRKIVTRAGVPRI